MGAGKWESELIEHGELCRLAELASEGPDAVDHSNAAGFEMLEISEGVKDLVSVAAVPGGRAHLIQNDGKLLFGHILGTVAMVDGAQGEIVCAAPFQLGEEGLEPVRLLVVDGDREWCSGLHGSSTSLLVILV